MESIEKLQDSNVQDEIIKVSSIDHDKTPDCQLNADQKSPRHISKFLQSVPGKWKKTLVVALAAFLVAVGLAIGLSVHFAKLKNDPSSVDSSNSTESSLYDSGNSNLIPSDSTSPTADYIPAAESVQPTASETVATSMAAQPIANANNSSTSNSSTTSSQYVEGLNHPFEGIIPDQGDVLGPRSNDEVRKGEAAAVTSSATPAKPIKNRGGPIMTRPIRINFLLYGDAFSSTFESTLRDFFANVGRSKWWNISTKYTTAQGRPVSRILNLGTGLRMPATKKQITDNDVYRFVKDSSWNHAFTEDDVYFVLSDSTVNETSGLCSSYCGWHSYYTSYYTNGPRAIKFAYVGSPKACPQSWLCSSLNQNNSPNNDFELDSMISIIAHELTEVATDPKLDAFYDDDGLENADKCSFNNGNVVQSGGKVYNEAVGGRNYLIQQNWDILTQKCTNGY